MTELIGGTHGQKLSPEARLRRSIKNARNRTRRGGETHPSCLSYGCSHKKHGPRIRKG